MAPEATTFDPGHSDHLNDTVLNYYGTLIATCSSDGTVRILDARNGQVISTLIGHQGAVWQVVWAHPKFGNMLASCSFDHHIIFWKEGHPGNYDQVYYSPSTLHSASINAISFASHELGLILAAASSDGTVSLIEYNTATGQWETTKLPGSHAVGATGVSWAPAIAPGALLQNKAPGAPVKRLVTCGCDNTVKVWKCDESGSWHQEEVLGGHTDWVRDVAWQPSLGTMRSTIASAGQDGQVFAWSERPGGGWDKKLINDFKAPVWRLSWSQTGNLLAVSSGDNTVTLWKESVDGVWVQVTQ